MSASREKARATPLLNSMLGTILLLVAGLDILLLGMIGWATWQRATLSEHHFQMRREDAVQMQGRQREAQELRALIGTTREAIAGTVATFPSDADVARYVSYLHSAAAASGAYVMELSPQPAPLAPVPVRRFTVRARGSWSSLLQFMAYVVQASLPTSRLEQVSLQQEGQQADLSFELWVAVRPSAVLSHSNPGDPNAAAPRPGPLAPGVRRRWAIHSPAQQLAERAA
jgi:Tfp pilus assembly protein PilO